MAIVERVGAEELSRELARRLAAAVATRDGPAGTRLGIEQEHWVRRRGMAIDYRDLAHRLASLGVAVHPTDPLVHLTPSGMALLADYDVAESASPPVSVGSGCIGELVAWAEEGARLLATTLDPGDDLDGASTHFSVEVEPALNDRLCLAYATTYAPGLMLLLDRRDSPGVLVRPRPGRAELCGEYASGLQLRAAAAYAVGSVLAVAADLRAGGWTGPPPARVGVEPARRRYGWYVARDAFGPDLYVAGRDARLRWVGGGGMSAQAYLEWGWARARAALAPLVDEAELADADAAVAGRAPLPIEAPAPAAPVLAGMWNIPCTRSPTEREGEACRAPIGRATAPRTRPCAEVRLHIATWDMAVFRITNGDGLAFAVVPHHVLVAFLDLLDGGELDDLLVAYLSRVRGERRVVARASDTEAAGLHDAVRRGADLLPEDRMGVGPGPISSLHPGKRVVPPPPVTGLGEPPERPPDEPAEPGGAEPEESRDEDGGGEIPVGSGGWLRWGLVAIGVAIALVVGAVVVGRGGDNDRGVAVGSEQTTTTASRTSPSTSDTSTVVAHEMRIEFVPSEFATHYTTDATDTAGKKLEFTWILTPPAADPSCNNEGDRRSSASEFVWHHGDQDGCDHNQQGALGHQGIVAVTVTDGDWLCIASYIGSQGPNDQPTATAAFSPCTPARGSQPSTSSSQPSTSRPISYQSNCNGPECNSVDLSTCDRTFIYDLTILTDPEKYEGQTAVVATTGYGLQPTYEVPVKGGKVEVTAVAPGAAYGGTTENGCTGPPGTHWTAYLISVGGQPTVTPDPPP